MDEKDKTCVGISRSDIQAEDYHCLGCTSATERVAILEMALAGAKLANERVIKDLIDMRILAGQLAITVESFRQRNVAECFCVSHFAAAHEGRCTLAELVLDKAKKLGVKFVGNN